MQVMARHCAFTGLQQFVCALGCGSHSLRTARRIESAQRARDQRICSVDQQISPHAETSTTQVQNVPHPVPSKCRIRLH